MSQETQQFLDKLCHRYLGSHCKEFKSPLTNSDHWTLDFELLTPCAVAVAVTMVDKHHAGAMHLTWQISGPPPKSQPQRKAIELSHKLYFII